MASVGETLGAAMAVTGDDADPFGAGSELGVLVIDETYPEPMRLLRRRPSGMPAIVLAGDDRARALHGEVNRTPQIGDVTILNATATPAEMIREIRRAIDGVERRTAHADLLIDLEAKIAVARGTTPAGINLGDVATHLPVGIVTIDPRGRVAGLNPAASRMLGLRTRAARPSFVSIFADPSGLEALLAAGWRASPSDPAPAASTLGLRTDRARVLTISVRPSRQTPGGEHIIALIEDVTALAHALRDVVRAQAATRKARDEAQALAERLTRLEQLRRTFLATLSHDARGPLTTLLGYAETLEAMGERMTAESRGSAYDAIARNSRRLLDLIVKLIDDSLISEIEPPADPVGVARIVEEAVGRLDHHGRIVTVSPSTVEARVNPTILERIVVNLVGNAIRHSPPSGSVRVDITRSGPAVLLSVSDEGPGVPDDVKDLIFTAFWRGAGSDGTGVGLWLVARLAELHGGSVHVLDRPGGGAIFRVLLAEPHRQSD